MGLLRFLLALSVLIGHVHGLPGLMVHGQTPYLLHGDAAVQAFYVISGFYMALVLDRVYAGSARNPVPFWTARYLRLAPLYVLISLLTAATMLATKGEIGLYAKGSLVDGAVAFLSNVTMLGQDLYMFLGYDTVAQSFIFIPDILRGGLERAGQHVAPGWGWLMIGQGWSIGVELWFYLLAPFLLRRHVGLILAVLAASFALRIYLSLGLGLHGDPWTHRFFSERSHGVPAWQPRLPTLRVAPLRGADDDRALAALRRPRRGYARLRLASCATASRSRAESGGRLRRRSEGKRLAQ